MAIPARHINQNLSTTAVAMVAVSGILSVIGLVIMAQYGLGALFYYAIVITTFFIPAVMVFSELGSGFPQAGGIYNWVTLAFGKTAGNIAIWSQWLGLIVSFPIILSFAISACVYPFMPQLIKEGGVILIGSTLLIIVATLASLRSVNFITFLSYFTAITAAFIPVSTLIVLAVYYLLSGHSPATPMHVNDIMPNLSHFSSFALIGATVFMFSGMELPANCINYMRKPRTQYAIAMIIAAVIVIAISVLGTLSISILVPQKHTSLIAGLIQAFLNGSQLIHAPWLPESMGILIALGFTSMMSVYLISLAKGIQAAAKDKLLPAPFAKENKRGIPTLIIVTLAGLSMFITLAFILLPSVHEAYWLIEAVVVVGSGFRYLIVFPAAIKLRYTHPDAKRIIKIPGGKIGVWVISLLPFSMVLFGSVMVFIPPPQFSTGSHWVYDLILALGSSIFIIVPLAVGYYSRRNASRRNSSG